jgi:hypothetical protein
LGANRQKIRILRKKAGKILGDVRIQKAFDLTQGIEAWYFDEETDLEQFKRNRSNFVSDINQIIIKASNQQMTADLTGLLENVQRTAESFCFKSLEVKRNRKPNQREFEAEWRRYVPENSIPSRYLLVQQRLGY